MTKNEKLNLMVYEKLSAEYDVFYEKLQALPPLEIIKASYEKVFKEDILLTFEERNLDSESAKAILKMDKPLDEFYQEWLNCDLSYMEDLRFIVDNRTEKQVAHLKSKNKPKER